MWVKGILPRANEQASRHGDARRALEVLNRLRGDHLLSVRFAVNVFIASIIVWITPIPHKCESDLGNRVDDRVG